MSQSFKLEAIIEGDSIRFVDAATKADDAQDKLQKGGEKLNDSNAKLEKSIGSLAKQLAELYSFKEVAGFAMDCVRAFGEQEKADLRLANSLRATGQYSYQNVEALKAFAGQMQQTTVYTDEQVEAAEALLARFRFAPGEIQRVTRAAADMATVLGMDLETAVRMLIKANEGNTQALGRYGIVVDESVPKGERFETIMRQINTQFGGAAQQDIDNTAGAIIQIGKAWDELKEKMGGWLQQNLQVKEAMQFWAKWLNGDVAIFGQARGGSGGGSQDPAARLDAVNQKIKEAESAAKRMAELDATRNKHGQLITEKDQDEYLLLIDRKANLWNYYAERSALESKAAAETKQNSQQQIALAEQDRIKEKNIQNQKNQDASAAWVKEKAGMANVIEQRKLANMDTIRQLEYQRDQEKTKLESYHLSTVESERYWNDRINKAKEDANQEARSLIEQARYDNLTKLGQLQADYDRELAIVEKAGQDRAAIDEKYARLRADLEKQEADKRNKELDDALRKRMESYKRWGDMAVNVFQTGLNAMARGEKDAGKQMLVAAMQQAGGQIQANGTTLFWEGWMNQARAAAADALLPGSGGPLRVAATNEMTQGALMTAVGLAMGAGAAAMSNTGGGAAGASSSGSSGSSGGVAGVPANQEDAGRATRGTLIVNVGEGVVLDPRRFARELDQIQRKAQRDNMTVEITEN